MTKNLPPQAALLAQFLSVRSASLRIMQGLSEEDCVVQSMPDASPLKWHLAHTTWFFETFVLTPFVQGYVPFDPAFKVLFNSYYNGVGEQFSRPQRGLITRPGLDRVKQYRQYVDQQMVAFLESAQASNHHQTVILGLNHEQQHQELMLTDFKHLLSVNPTQPVFRPLSERSEAYASLAPNTWRRFAEGVYEIGVPSDAQYFHFDNEGPRHKVYVQAFEIASHCVTNGEYLEFMQAGGYQLPQWWLSAGWDTVRQQGWHAPMYWYRDESQRWCTFTLHGAQLVDMTAPVSHISHYEADAFARWAATTYPQQYGACRLPTEAEWEIAAAHEQAQQQEQAIQLFDDVQCEPLPQTQDASMLGTVWQWTQSSYAAYPGFAPAAGAVGEYNGKFMNNQYVLRGGSCATPAGHIRTTYRNFFASNMRWQFCGVRLARDL